MELKVNATKLLDNSLYDGVLLICQSSLDIPDNLSPLVSAIRENELINKSFLEDGGVIAAGNGAVPGSRIVFSPTGPLDRDFDDVRRFGDAGCDGIKRAVKAGIRKPLLVCLTDYENSLLVSLLGVFHGLYVPLEVREDVPYRKQKIDYLGVYGPDGTEKIVSYACALEAGRFVCRDIGGSDPERMSPTNVEKYVVETFKGSSIDVKIISDFATLEKQYPLFQMVNRGSVDQPRHHGRIMFLTYEGEGPIKSTLYLVGKGVTYDTGGHDIKAGGVMAGMHRDKCGAAAVAGFFETLKMLRPKHVKVVGGLAMVRNSVGVNAYVADELVTSRAGVRVRIGNTDAEGRMAMADVLCKFKEDAINAVNPRLMTIATLTGHACLAVDCYSIILDNGPARAAQVSQSVSQYGEKFGDPFEVSTLRREDYIGHKGQSEYEEVVQSNNSPSVKTARGHQKPAAFMIMASGLDKHGINSKNPLPYSHIDIAGSSGPYPGIPSGAPIVALAATFLK